MRDFSGIYMLADVDSARRFMHGDIIVERKRNGHYKVSWMYTYDKLPDVYHTDNNNVAFGIASVERWAQDPKIWILKYPLEIRYPDGI